MIQITFYKHQLFDNLQKTVNLPMILHHWMLTEKADRFINVTYYFYIIYWTAFNQTRMELKLNRNDGTDGLPETFNQTRMELKLRRPYIRK